MAEDSGAILRHISSLKDMVDKVNEEIERNIQKTREIESEIVQHSETEKHYLNKESELTKEVSVTEFELNGLIQVAAAESDFLKVAEGNLEFQKVAQDRIRKRLSDKMEKFINESMGFQANMLKSSSEDLVLLLNEKSSLEDESAKLRMKINTIHNSSTEYIAEILEEVNTENSGSLKVCGNSEALASYFSQDAAGQFGSCEAPVGLGKPSGCLGEESELSKMPWISQVNDCTLVICLFKVAACQMARRMRTHRCPQKQEDTVLESELRYMISEYKDVQKDINNLKILFSSSNS